MKRNLVIIGMILFLSLGLIHSASAESLMMAGIGMDATSFSYYNASNSNFLCFSYCYFLTKYAGMNTFKFSSWAYSDTPHLFALNYSKTTGQILSTTDCGGAPNNTSISCDSNAGIYKYNTGGWTKASDSSVINNYTTYDFRNFTSGSTVVIPMVNMFYPAQYTVFSPAVHNFYSTNSSRVYTKSWKVSCAYSDEIADVQVINSLSSGYYQFFYMSSYFTEHNPIDFLTYSPYDLTINSDSPETIVFNVIANYPESVDGYAWYVDGEDQSSTHGTDNNSFSIDTGSLSFGTHTITIQLENIVCYEYPTMSWTLTTSTNLVNLQGTVYSNITGYVTTLSGASIDITSGSLSASTTSTTNGSYSFPNILAGTYSVLFSKPSFDSTTLSKTCSIGTCQLNAILNQAANITNGTPSLSVNGPEGKSNAGDYHQIFAHYYVGNYNIPGATCYLITANGLTPTYLELTAEEGYYTGMVQITEDLPTGYYQYNVTCFSSEFTSASVTKYFQIPLPGTTITYWTVTTTTTPYGVTTTTIPGIPQVSVNGPQGYVNVNDWHFIFASYHIGSNQLWGATCKLAAEHGLWPGNITLEMTEDNPGYYTGWVQIEENDTGSWSYTVTCNKTGYATADQTLYFSSIIPTYTTCNVSFYDLNKNCYIEESEWERASEIDTLICESDAPNCAAYHQNCYLPVLNAYASGLPYPNCPYNITVINCTNASMYDLNQDCFITPAEYQIAADDYNHGNITLSCYNEVYSAFTLWTMDTAFYDGCSFVINCTGNYTGNTHTCIEYGEVECPDYYDRGYWNKYYQCYWSGGEVDTCLESYQACNAPPQIGIFEPPLNETPDMCGNLTGKLMNGEVLPVAMCAYILPLGLSWVIGLLILFAVVLSYMISKNWIPSGIIGLLLLSIFFDYLPQVFKVLSGVILALGLAAIFVSLYNKRGQ